MSALEINMSLAKIEKLGVPIPNIGRETERTALAFALDSAYLMPFKAMVFSMARTGTMLDSPLYVLSDTRRSLMTGSSSWSPIRWS